MHSVTLRIHDPAIFAFIFHLLTLLVYVLWLSVLFIFSYSLFHILELCRLQRCDILLSCQLKKKICANQWSRDLSLGIHSCKLYKTQTSGKMTFRNTHTSISTNKSSFTYVMCSSHMEVIKVSVITEMSAIIIKYPAIK